MHMNMTSLVHNYGISTITFLRNVLDIYNYSQMSVIDCTWVWFNR